MYPYNIDQFTIKKDHIIDLNGNVVQEGDDVLAEHINALQDGVVSIQTTLGLSPQGKYTTVAQRLDEIGKVGLLRVPSVCMYYGAPKSINGSTTIEQAIDEYTKYDYVIFDTIALDDVEPRATTAYGIINNCDATFIGRAPISLVTMTSIKETIFRWSQVKAKGILLDEFDYTYLDRTQQNELLDYVHSLGMFAVMSGNASHILENTNIDNKNPRFVAARVRGIDIYLVQDFAIGSDGSYEALSALKARMDGCYAYVQQFGIGLWTQTFISTQTQYYYVNNAAMLYSIDAMFTSPDYYTATKFSEIPLVGDYREEVPSVLFKNNVLYRTAKCGTIQLKPAGESHVIGGKVPADFIDPSVINIGSDNILSLDSSKLTGDIHQDRMKANVIKAINLSVDPVKISENQIGTISGLKIIQAVIDALGSQDEVFINQLATNMLHVLNDMTVEGSISADRLKANVIQAVNAYIGNAKIDAAHIGSLDADNITAAVIDAINGHIGDAKIDAAKIDKLTADHINAIVIQAINASIENATIDSARISDLGVDNMSAKVISAINASIEAAVINAAKIGELTVDNLKASVISAINASIETAKIDAAYVGEMTVDHIKAAAIDAVTAKLNELITSELEADHAKINSLSANIVEAINMHAGTVTAEEGKFTTAIIGELDASRIKAASVEAMSARIQELLVTEANIKNAFIDTLAANIINAINLHADDITANTAQIAAARIGELTSDHIVAVVVDALEANIETLRTSLVIADQARINNLSAEIISAINFYAENVTGDKATFNAATIGELTVDNLKANAINAIQAYIDDLDATSGSFQDLLTDALSARLINANNVRITSAAGTGNPGDALLTIDQAGMIIQSKAVADSSTKVLKITKDGLFISRNGGNLIDNTGMQINGRWDLKIDGERLYIDAADINELAVKNAHIESVTADKLTAGTISASKNIKFVAAAGSTGGNSLIIDDAGLRVMDNPTTPTKYVRLDKDGLAISKDGTTWTTKLDADKLYVTAAEIPNLTAEKITSGSLDANNVTISGGDVKLDKDGITIDGTTGKGLSIKTADAKYITLNKDGLVSENFSITSSGSVTVKGTVQGTAGYFGTQTGSGETTVTNGVAINSTGLEILGTGTIKNSNTEISSNRIVIKNGTTEVLELGLYDADKYGLATSDHSVILDANGLKIDKGTSSIKLGYDQSSQKYNFQVGGDGKLYAVNADISGKITATEGYFGTANNQVIVSTTGLDIGDTGEIYNPSRNLVLNKDGITATSGTIGSVTLDADGLHAPNLVDFISTGIALKGSRALTIDNGTMVITNNSVDYMTIGNIATGSYGLRLDIPNSTAKVYLNESGFSIAKNGTTKTFETDISGNIKITGEINATSGTFSNITVSGAITVGAAGSITAGDATLSSTGLAISGTGSSITLGGGNFSVTGAGALTAKSGKIGGITIGSSSLTAGSVVINSTGKIDIGSALTLGLYDTNTYGLKINAIHPIYLNSTGLSSDNFIIDAATGDVTIEGDINATSGTFSGVDVTGNITVKTGGSLIAGGTTLSDAGISMTQGSISLNSGVFAVDNSGNMTAKSGTIGGVTIAEAALTAGKATISSTGVAIKNASDTDVIKLGEYSTGSYGMLVDAGATNITLDESGLKAVWTDPENASNTKTVFSIGTDGNLSVIGNVTATGGTFTGTVYASAGSFAGGKVTINSTGLNIETGGIIKAGATELSSTGISIGTGSVINLGSGKFIANDAGITAVGGSIGGWKLTSSKLYSGDSEALAKIAIDSANQSITVGSVILGKYGTDVGGNALYGLKMGANIVFDAITGLIASNELGTSKLWIKPTGDVYMSGEIVSTKGTIGGWTIDANGISKKDAESNLIIGISNTDELISVKDAVKLGKYDGTNYGLKLGSNITFNNTDGLVSSNFSIDTSGNAYFHGKIEADQGYFGTAENGVSIGATGLNVLGYGIIEAGNTTISSTGIQIGNDSTINLNNNFIASNDGITAIAGKIANWQLSNNAIYSGASLATSKFKLDSSVEKLIIGDNDVVLGKYDGVNYGLQIGPSIIFNPTYGLNVYNGTENTLTIDADGNITMKGDITAENGTFNGTIHSQEGYFGTATDNVSITASGLSIAGNGSIRLGDDTVQLTNSGLSIKKGSIELGTTFSVDNNGAMKATSATFGTVIVDDFGLTAGETKLTNKGLNVTGTDGVIIDNGSATIKDEAGFERIKLGKSLVNGGNIYGLALNGATLYNSEFESKAATTEGTEKIFVYASQAEDKSKLKHMRLTMTITNTEVLV
jgi:hypothetical protein